MKIRLTQIDGSLPNLALMKLSHYYKSNGHEVFFERSIHRNMFEPDYDLVLGSAIFSTSEKKIRAFKEAFPNAVVGGTGSENMSYRVEDMLNIGEYEFYDYSTYPEFEHSIGFSQRGCRLACKFCVVPKKEGKVNTSRSIYDIWRGEPYPKKIHLLDNDFFGDPNWKAKCNEIREGNFEICINQGINVRLINQEQASELATLKYRDDQFKAKRIYTAWDNKRDEGIFKKGVGYLLNAGVRPSHILVYFLCGYWKDETFADIWYRYETMKGMGLLPFPMVYSDSKDFKELKKFQRWVIRRYDQFVSWEEFKHSNEKAYYAKKNGTVSLSF